MDGDSRELQAKMKEIADRGMYVIPDADAALREAAKKELEAEGDKAQKCADCPGEGKKCNACAVEVPYVSSIALPPEIAGLPSR